jgi:Flp pilus assembly protein TadD
MVFFRAGQLENACKLMSQAVQLAPDSAENFLNFSAILATMGKLDAAQEAVQKAIALRPQYPEALNNLGNLLLAQQKTDEAMSVFRQALDIAPQFFEPCANLGTALLKKEELADAEKYLRQAAALRPGDSEVQFNLAMTLQFAGKFPESKTCYTRSIELNPENFAARVNFAVLLLAMGETDAAWRMFFQAGEFNDPLLQHYPGRRWTGQDIKGKTILVFTDNQFGDSILLSRFIAPLKQRGAKIILQCKPQLTTLFESLDADAIVSTNHPAAAFDWYIPLWSLPFRLGFSIHTIPSRFPYLSPPKIRSERWAKIIPSDGKINIGLVWAAGDSEARSNQLQLFSPLAAIPNVRFVSLQKGPQAAQRPPDGMVFLDPTAEISDFADTAAIVANLDLVISVDTSVAHVAGALGKPVWTLIPYRTSFLWSLSHTDSPWYPTMRLFRQNIPRDWNVPIQEIARALQEFSASTI